MSDSPTILPPGGTMVSLVRFAGGAIEWLALTHCREFDWPLECYFFLKL
jgi:hypothetical protein